MHNTNKPSFSISFFGTYPAEYSPNKYGLLFKSAEFADVNGFEALWIPERHFHPFGGFSPNPSVLAGALSRVTKNVQLRAGSVVLPLHHPARIVEEWSVVDNCSEGRAGLAFASGWHPNDFILTNNDYENRKTDLFDQIETVRDLWEGKTLPFEDVNGKKIDVSVHPRPLQKTLPMWVAVLGSPESYEKAGELGIGILTNLIAQDTTQLAEGIKIYKESLKKHGHSEESARVCVLLHTFVGADQNEAIETARRPLYNYLSSSMQLFQKTHAEQENATQLDRLSEEDKDFVFGRAYQRYVDGHALIGNVESCLPTLQNLQSIGVTEFAAFIDFGVDHELVYDNLRFINELKDRFNNLSSSPQKQEIALNEYQSIAMAHGLSQNPQVQLSLKGKLNEDLLIDCIQKVVTSHESLCTHFSEGGDSLYLQGTPAMSVHQEDMQNSKPEDVESTLAEMRTTKLNPSAELLHVHLLKTAKDKFVLSLTASPLVCDGDSLIVLLRDIADKYNASMGETVDGFDSLLQLSEYMSEKETRYSAEQIRVNEEFWQKQFPKSVKPQSKTSFGTCASIDLEISNDLARKCKKMAVKMKCTPFMLFMSAYARYIQSISKKNDVAILTPAGNRKVLGNTNFVGNITFNLPIRIPDAIAARDLTKFKQLLGEVFDHYYATPQFLSDCLEATHIPAYAFEMNRRPVITLNKLECDLTTAFPLPYNAVAGLSLNESGATITAQWSYDSTSETEAEVKARHDEFIEILEEMTFVGEAIAA